MNVTSLWQPVIVWLLIMVALVVAELITMGLTTIWFAGGAFVAALTSLMGFSVWVQIIVFLTVSLLLLFFTRPIAVKYFNKDRIKTNVESLVGRQAIVISEIDNVKGWGRVTVGGQEWSARAREDEAKLPVGVVADVVGIHGVKLIVEERKEGM